MSNQKQLQEEIDKRKKQIHADSYPMSIGEVINLYKDSEIEIRPEFQRYFRWSIEQKTSFIESILLGIPVPSFFVSQREDGIWEVVDGLQRLSTIFEFVGELRNEDGTRRAELSLVAAKYLTQLDGVKWSKLGTDFKLAFKREKIDFKIIKKESTPDTKYEIFQRLNTGGSSLSAQEVRNCILLMTNKDFFKWFESLIENEDYNSCVVLSDNQMTQRYDLDSLTRFLVFQNALESYFNIDVGIFLNEQIVKIALSEEFNYSEQKGLFEKVFALINKSLGEDAFRRYVSAENKHKGAFSVALFETITYGIGKNIEQYSTDSASDISIITEKIRELSRNALFLRYSGSGSNARTRIPNLLPFAKEHFRK